MLSSAMSGQMSGYMSGNFAYPTCVSRVLSMVWTRYVGNVGFLKQERSRENLNCCGPTGGLE